MVKKKNERSTNILQTSKSIYSKQQRDSIDKGHKDSISLLNAFKQISDIVDEKLFSILFNSDSSKTREQLGTNTKEILEILRKERTNSYLISHPTLFGAWNTYEECISEVNGMIYSYNKSAFSLRDIATRYTQGGCFGNFRITFTNLWQRY